MKSEHYIPFYNRLIFRLALPLGVLILVLFSILALFVWYTYRSDEQKADIVPTTAARELQKHIATFFDIEYLNLNLASKSIVSLTLDDDDQNFLRDIVVSDKAILELAVYSTTREEVFRATEPTSQAVLDARGQVVKKSHERVLATKKGDITEPQESQYQTSYIVWTLPLFSSQHQLIGLVSAVIDISTFWRYTSLSAPPGLDAHMYITDQNGTILVSNKNITSKNATVPISDILFLVADSNETLRYRGVQGIVVGGKAERLSPTTWYGVAEVSLDDLTVASRQNILVLVFAAGFFSLLMFYIFYAFHYNLSRPLAVFRKGIVELTNGNYATRIAVGAKNEFSLLANVMNHMAESIEAQTSEIVTRLKQTIAELDRSNKAVVKRDEELSSANDRLKRLDHAKSEFVSIAAHQLRTPLSALKWAQQMLLDGEMGAIAESQKALLLQSQESVRRMVTLVNDLLAADHLEYGKVAYTFAKVNPEAIVSGALAELRPMADGNKITIDCVLNNSVALMTADSDRLKEAFLNVISNAIKYTQNGGTVTIRAQYGMGKVSISIADTGIGIPQADSDRLFEKFVRMENAKKVDANGSGLGLFIVKKIIEAHNGRIWFSSIEGQGTTFFIEFPLVNN